jgi:predicted amidophosphoribosyltransferase
MQFTLDSILDIIFPVEVLGANKLTLEPKDKPSLNSDYTIHTFTDYSQFSEIIHRIKNNDEFSLAKNLTKISQDGFQNYINSNQINLQNSNSVITFVPPDPVRGLHKPFSLSRFLARNISSQYPNLQFQQLISKTKTSAKQSYLSREDRIKNFQSQDIFSLYKSFQLFNFLESKTITNYDYIFLFDDIVTTGATIEACYRTLKESYPNSKIIPIALSSNYENN